MKIWLPDLSGNNKNPMGRESRCWRLTISDKVCSIEQQASGEVQPDYFGPRGLVQIVNWSQASYKRSRWLQMKDFLCRISRKILLTEIFQIWGSKTLLTIGEDLRLLHCTAASSQFRSSLELSERPRSLKESHIPALWSLSKYVYYRKEKTDLRPSEVCKRTVNTHWMPTRGI